ncbi:GH92 family glycosyl hydrolase [Fulvivirga sp.]|uniref:GH92 family glycosyl hydrolase n=1 Tax=Fulvivirga sp. TaxID=1931237 RepID=UPI0032ECA33B
MKQTLSTLIILSILFFSCSKQEKALHEYVNPFIGTGGHGHTYPGASAPFGGVQLSPDTRLEGWDGCGGYHYSDSVIYGFSHTHLSGTGIPDYADFLFMPATGKPKFDNGYKTSPDQGYASRFSHSNEKAIAGYYQVFLSDYNINVELTSTTRAGFHKYSFDNPEDAYIIIDLEHRDELLDYKLEVVDNKTVQGMRISKSWAVEQYAFFYAELSEAAEEFIYNQDSTKLIMKFSPKKEILVKTGISAVSTEGAKKNLHAEIPDWDFEVVKTQTQMAWDKELAKIEVETVNDIDKEIFYTALYHTYLNPNTFQDVDGQYRGTDLKVHGANGFNNYTIFSLWDTYRGAHPLYTITQQERTKDFINTFLNHYKNGGKLPMWELSGNYTYCMVGYHSVPVIVDAYQKGLTDFDTELALEAMIKTATADELGKQHYIQKGYMASDEEHESVSKNLEYAYDDWCIAQFAKALGNTEVYEEYTQRAQNYKNIFEPTSEFMRAKRNQQFTEPFNPTEVNFNFTEANSWQYSFYVPQDISGLIKLYGGQEKFEEKLDLLFSTTNETSGREQVDITGLVGQYAHGNEPSHHMTYLYNFIGKPWKTQERVRQMLDEMYTNQPDGLIGNEDCGQMSAWYVLSAIGFYPVTPGSTDYIIGSPKVKSANVNLENGKTFFITVNNQSKDNIYVKSMYLNGQPYNKSFISHTEIMKGGELIFEMSAEPNTKWEHEIPATSIEDQLITAVPYVEAESQVFFDSLKVELKNIDSNANIYFTLDGSTPTAQSDSYSDPIILNKTATIKMLAIVEGQTPSKEAVSKFIKVDSKRTVTYKNKYNTQYAGGGENGLIDYIRGGDDFRTGAWQGWQGQDVELVIDLNVEQNIKTISAGFLQDIKSWIWMPKKVTYSVSNDGKNFKEVATITGKTDDHEEGVVLDNYTAKVNTKAKYVKVQIESYGEVQEWHLGAGGQSWVFVDEVVVE